MRSMILLLYLISVLLPRSRRWPKVSSKLQAPTASHSQIKQEQHRLSRKCHMRFSINARARNLYVDPFCIPLLRTRPWTATAGRMPHPEVIHSIVWGLSPIRLQKTSYNAVIYVYVNNVVIIFICVHVVCNSHWSMCVWGYDWLKCVHAHWDWPRIFKSRPVLGLLVLLISVWSKLWFNNLSLSIPSLRACVYRELWWQ